MKHTQCFLSLFAILHSGATLAQDIPLPELDVTAVKSAEVIPNKTLKNEDMRQSRRSDLSESLSIIPSVRVSDTASNSLQQSDLEPAEFSIRGAAFYQNNIQLDNAGIDSFLDPANKLSGGDYPSRTSVAGHSQSVFIEPSFLSEIEVIDSNAAASEGGFTGGVVKAKTRKFEGESEFSVSHRITKDSWSSFHIDPTQLSDFEDGAAQRVTGIPGEFQPSFDKTETLISGRTRVGNIGIFAGYSDKRSSTVQKRTSTLAVLYDFDYFLETGNVFLRETEDELESHSRFATVRADLLDVPYDLYVTLAHSDYSKDSFLINFLNSDYTSNIKGTNLSVNFGNDYGATRVDTTLAINFSDNARDSDSQTLSAYNGRNFYTDNQYVGSYGSLETQQTVITASADMITTVNEVTNLRWGAEIKRVDLQQHRAQDYVESQFYPENLSDLNGLNGAVPYDEHYLYEEVTYGAGDIAFLSMNLAAYLQLDGMVNHWFYHGGLRATRDDFLANNNIAPRVSFGRYFGADDSTRFEIGANRYYGKSFLSYKLADLQKQYVTTVRRETQYDPTSPFETFSGNDEWLESDLDTPFNDELSLELSTALWHSQAGIQFVRREGKDEIRTNYDSDTGLYQYVNRGQSTTQQVDVYWRTPAYQWLAASWRVNTMLSWTQKESDQQYFSGYSGTEDAKENVIFEGEEISRYELQAADYSVPIRANVDVFTTALEDRLTLSNRFTFTSGYEAVSKTGEDDTTGLDMYEVVEQGSTFSWDVSVHYTLPMFNAEPYVKVDVVNLTNKSNVIRAEEGVQLFGIGRQFWLEFGINI
ncbi:TonB-dependent receptor plug domain-containing protein [Alteromonas sp. 14N.309.X.WAT.G.H12]|uniref:TonB-dependent receptor plug domain-containing protein n=1 Tax=Alteromonas sp. 14N.309.X.WAT.G.H12 TaxID=3120824 RepID=UPI002FD5AF7A